MTRPTNLIIPTERVPVAAYQAIYHQLTRKTESISKLYAGAFFIEKNDIEQLYVRLAQSLAQYHVQNQRCEISISFEEWAALGFSSIDRFVAHNLQIVPSETRLITFEYDFLITLPVEIEPCDNIAQRYKLEIKINQKDDDLVNAVAHLPARKKRSDFEDDISVYIEYTDFSVGRTIQTTVEDWIASLKNEDPKLEKRNRSKRIVRSLDILSPAIFVLSLLGSAIFDTNRWPGPIAPIRYLLISLAIAVAFTIVMEVVSSRISRYLSTSSPRNVIRLTKGDQDGLSNRLARLSSYKRRTVFWCVTVLVGILVNVFSSYIASALIAGVQ